MKKISLIHILIIVIVMLFAISFGKVTMADDTTYWAINDVKQYFNYDFKFKEEDKTPSIFADEQVSSEVILKYIGEVSDRALRDEMYTKFMQHEDYFLIDDFKVFTGTKVEFNEDDIVEIDGKQYVKQYVVQNYLDDGRISDITYDDVARYDNYLKTGDDGVSNDDFFMSLNNGVALGIKAIANFLNNIVQARCKDDNG